MAWLRVDRSLARLVLCSASDSVAFLVTVSSSARLSPRCGTRSVTRPPRSEVSHSWIVSASGGRTGTSTSRGTACRLATARQSALALPAGPPGRLLGSEGR